ncbi:MAG: rubrerythrin family protein [Kiritimatiellaeota bacterium]|nr:rubrerythrin family protein [Kiritimatiellota bacterium]
MDISDDIRRTLLRLQQAEITEYEIYRRLAQGVRDPGNRAVLERVADDERRHAGIWQRYTGVELAPRNSRVRWYWFLARTLGLTFALKLMENGERKAEVGYGKLSSEIPQAATIAAEEERHEHELLNVLDEERLRYAGSVVLGLSDALVELTGALAGLTLALRNTQLIALAGLVTGLAASLSMAASEYLSTKSEVDSGKIPWKASLYTGTAYLLTVAFLIFPYLVLSNYLLCFAWTAVNAVIVIALFTFYIAVARDLSFRTRFLEMTGLSLGVAVLSFGIGVAVRHFLGVDV